MPVLQIVTPPLLTLTGPQTVTLSGEVRDAGNNALSGRSIRVFAAESMTVLLGQTYSLSDGSWSVTVPGVVGTSYVVLAQSEGDENGQIFVRVKKES